MVLLEIITEEAKSEGGILLLHTAGKSATETGVVLAVGEGKMDGKGNRIPMDSDIKVGATVAITTNNGQIISDTQRVVEDTDILYVVV